MEIITIVSHYFFGVNTYLLKTGGGCFLIDTGMAKKRAQLEMEMREAGCQPGDLRLIIITHGHLDHARADNIQFGKRTIDALSRSRV